MLYDLFCSDWTPYMARNFYFGGASHIFGPLWSQLSRDLHERALAIMFDQVHKVSDNDFKLSFFLEVDGSFAPFEIREGVLRRNYYPNDRLAMVTLGIPLEMVCEEDEERFRNRFARLHRTGIRSLVGFLQKKKVALDYDEIVKHVDIVLDFYESLPIPFSNYMPNSSKLPIPPGFDNLQTWYSQRWDEFHSRTPNPTQAERNQFSKTMIDELKTFE